MGVPRDVATTITARVLQSLRGHCLGVTIVAGFLFGAVGLILRAPLSSAAVRIATDLGQAQVGSEPTPAETT